MRSLPPPILPSKAEGLSDKEISAVSSMLAPTQSGPSDFELRYAHELIKALACMRKNSAIEESPEYHLSMLLKILYVAYIPFTCSSIRILTRLYLAYTYNNLKRCPKDRLPKKSGYYRIAGERVFLTMLDVAKKFYSAHKPEIDRSEPMDYAMVRQALDADFQFIVAMKCSSTLVRPAELTLESFSERLCHRVPIFKKEKCGHYFPALSKENLEEFSDL